ncbi:MAG: DUF1129 domain-containing protein [Lactobacillaceae bacterium]|jgi:uncharacterized membrane-anchored protein|nr:DUF1129 domain-containing protein [Lactobacillaceae bacterium]
MTEEQTPAKVPTRQDLAASGLSKRNQEFLYHTIILVTNEEKQAPLIKEIQTELLAAQKTGKTARQLYGTPADALGVKLTSNRQANPGTAYGDYKYLDLTIDNTLTFLMLFSMMFGITLMFQKQTAGSTPGAAGITALLITSVLGGLLFAFGTKAIASGIKKVWSLLTAVAAFVLWFAIYLGVAMLPAVVNPILPGFVYIAIAVATFFGFRAWRKKTGITGGFLGGSTRRPIKK